MKYLKRCEARIIDRRGQDKYELDENKIYVYKEIISFPDENIPEDKEEFILIIGTLKPHQMGITITGYILEGDKKGKEISKTIVGNYFPSVREATPEEIEEYELLDTTNKYNL